MKHKRISVLAIWVAAVQISSASWTYNFNAPPPLLQPNVLFFGDAKIVEPKNGEGFVSLSGDSGNRFGAVIFRDVFDFPIDLFALNLDVASTGMIRNQSGLSISFPNANDPLLSAVRFDNPEINLDSIDEYFAGVGTHSGISVEFDPWQNESSEPQFGVSLRFNNELIRHVSLAAKAIDWNALQIQVVPGHLRQESTVFVGFQDQEVMIETIPYFREPAKVVLAATSNTNAPHFFDNISFITEILLPAGDNGDFNEDGVLAVDDFQILTGNMNTGSPQTVEYFDGDIDYSGRIDLADFVLFRNEWQRQSDSGAKSVPEPRASVLSMMSLLSVICWLKTSRSFPSRKSWMASSQNSH